LAPEQKIIVRSLPSIFPSISTTWVESELANIGQGTSLITRIGNQVRLIRGEIFGIICPGISGTAIDDSYNVLRIVIGVYRWSGVTPLATGGASLNAPVATNYNTAGRLVRKLYDSYIPLSAATIGISSGYAPRPRNFSLRFPLKYTVVYGSSDATQANMILVMSCISDSTTSPNPGFVSGYTRVYYTDQ